MPLLLRPAWLAESYRNYVTRWLLTKWSHTQGWERRFPELIMWYATAGSAMGSDAAADTVIEKTQGGETLTKRQKSTWDDAQDLAREICSKLLTNPLAWLTYATGYPEKAWRDLDDLYGIGPKIASFIMRDLSLIRDYTDSVPGLTVAYGKRAKRKWFARLSPEDQALFIPIDVHVHRAASENRVATLFDQFAATDLQDEAELHRQAAQEIVKWSRGNGFDPRDVDIYWYSLGAGNIKTDGTEVP